jgi:putative phage-type endonuclease
MTLEVIEQRTPEWYALRKQMITASDWATALGKSKNQGKRNLILKKCDRGVPFTGNVYTQWGQKYEPVANRIYELRQGVKVHEFGVLRHPKYYFLGASPDGITPDGIMLEIKCPPLRVIDGKVPVGYMIQVQGQLEICDLEYCDFFNVNLKNMQILKNILWIRVKVVIFDMILKICRKK